MAKIKFYKNLLDEKFDIKDIKEGTTVKDAINAYQPDNPYSSELVECYDPDEDKTFYIPLDNTDEPNVLVTVNESIISPNYIIRKNDLVNVVYIPADDGLGGRDMSLMQWIAFGFSTAVGTFAGAVAGFFAGGIPGAIIGGAGGAAAGAGVFVGIYDATKGQYSKNVGLGEDIPLDQIKAGENLKQIPSVRGASNQKLLGNSYPFVIGKQLITPFIVGNPITEYSGTFGQDAYVSLLLCAGYGPLKLTDFRLDQTLLAYNRSHNNNTEKKTLLNGMLEYRDSSGKVTGDILDIWNDNDVKLEIIQQPNELIKNRGTLYPYVKIDKEIGANCIYVADGDLQQQAEIVYKGATFPTNFRNNNVYFSESCPKKITLTLSASSGLFKTRSAKNGPEYGSIPIWFAVQYRYYNEDNAVSDSNGTDHAQWKDFDNYTMNGISIREQFTEELRGLDIEAHTGNDLSNQDINKGWVGANLFNFGKFSGEEYNKQMRFVLTADLENTADQCFQIDGNINKNSIKGVEVRIIRVSPSYLDERTGSGETGPYSFSDLIKVDTLITEIFDEEYYKKNKKAINVYAIPNDSDLNKFCYIAISAKADNNGYIGKSLQKISCIAESFSPHWDAQAKKWLPEGVETKTKYIGYFDKKKVTKEELVNSVDRLQHDDARVNPSQDAWEVELLYDDIEASSEEKERLAMCELGRARREGGVRIDPETKEEIRYGLNWLPVRGGSNYLKKIKEKVFTDNYLSAAAAIYNDNSSASGAMLAMVGPQAGLAALGYDNINLTSFGEWAEDSAAVIDGSTNQDGSLSVVKMCANGYVYKGEKFESLLAKIVATGRAIYTYDTNGKIKVIMDKPVDYPVGVISDQNCEMSQNAYTYNETPAGLAINFQDENDGYETNTFFCWADGNNYDNYKGQVIPYSLPFVTNPAQCWSLSRYFLASSLLNRSILTRKVGPEGCVYELGDVVIVQSNSLLIGSDSSGRIQKILMMGNKCYGVITDSVYTYDENVTMGITIVQSKCYGKKSSITEKIAKPGVTVIIDDVEYIQKRDLTNVALFETPLIIKKDGQGKIINSRYDFDIEDVCLFGKYGQEDEKYRIVKIKQDSETTFTQTLVRYNEDLYNYGAELPSFQSFRRVPDVIRDPSQLSEVPKNLVELNDRDQGNNEFIQNQLSHSVTVSLYKKSEDIITSANITTNGYFNIKTNKIKWGDPAGSNGWVLNYENIASSSGGIYMITASIFTKDTNVIIRPNDWSYPIPSSGENGKPGLTIFLEKSALVYKADSKGAIEYNKTSSRVIMKQFGADVPFFFGDIEVPAGFSIKTTGTSVIIEALAGSDMNNQGIIKIPINYHPIVKVAAYGNEANVAYGTDKPNQVYGNYKVSNDTENFDLYISYAKAMRGDSISKVIEYYGLSKSSTEKPTEWFETIPEYYDDYKFLWNKEVSKFSSGDIAAKTEPALVGNLTEDGAGIDNIVNYYQISDSVVAPSTEGFTPLNPVGWTDSNEKLFTTDDNRYLWNFEYITFTQGKAPKLTTPAIIGTHGSQGVPGEQGADGPQGERAAKYWGIKSEDPPASDVIVGDYYLRKSDVRIRQVTSVGYVAGILKATWATRDPNTKPYDELYRLHINDVTSILANVPKEDAVVAATNAYFDLLLTNTAFINKLFAKNISILENGYIQSDNFTSGSDGFRIESNGNVEFNRGTFNNVFVSGEINAKRGVFEGYLKQGAKFLMLAHFCLTKTKNEQGQTQYNVIHHEKDFSGNNSEKPGDIGYIGNGGFVWSSNNFSSWLSIIDGEEVVPNLFAITEHCGNKEGSNWGDTWGFREDLIAGNWDNLVNGNISDYCKVVLGQPVMLSRSHCALTFFFLDRNGNRYEPEYVSFSVYLTGHKDGSRYMTKNF